MHRRSQLLILFAILCGLASFVASQAGTEKLQILDGKVIPLESKDSFGLKTGKGEVYPLLKDKGSLMFFQDRNLLNRPMRLTGKLIGSPPQLQVINAHSLLLGKPHDIYYWCEVCVIKRFQPGICDCCGDKLEFREVPVRD